MAWNQKIAFRIFLSFLVVVFLLTLFLVFFRGSGSAVENILKNVGFDSSDGSENSPVVPLISGNYVNGGNRGSETGGSSSGGASGVAGGGSSGSGSGTGENIMSFCTFDAFHVVNGEIPCRCGSEAICYNLGDICDATFNNGRGVCSQ